MVKELVTTELAKLAVQKLGEVKLDDAVGAVRSLRRAAGGTLVVPTAVTLGIGVAVGVAVGVLLAPRAGRETRDAIRDAVRRRVGALAQKLGRQSAASEATNLHDAATAQPGGNGMPN